METVIKSFLGDVAFSAEKFGSGHINSTYRLTTDKGLFVLQQINCRVFKNPANIMQNIAAVTNHLQNKRCGTMTFLPCQDGSFCCQDREGNYWRLSAFVPGLALDAPEKPEDLYQAGLAFGQFQQDLADFPADTLYETIKDFHNTPVRYRQFYKALQEDTLNRAKDCRDLTQFLREKETLAGTLQQLYEAKKLPLRVTHNDTKLNNVLLDPVSRKPVCVLDLDTVMPGLSGYDFGDGIRFGAATEKEDANHNSLDLDLFEMYASGYLQAATDLTPEELRVLPLSAFIMTLECGMRFLTDYLEGDRYFGTTFPGQNLLRARNQLTLAEDIEKKLPQMEAIIEKIRTPK